METVWAYVLALVLVILPKEACSAAREVVPSCTDRDGRFTVEDFKLKSCAACFWYLFRLSRPDVRLTGTYRHVLNKTNTRMNEDGQLEEVGHELHFPDVTNTSTISPLCATLSFNDCQRWRRCCQAGIACCQRQHSLSPGTQGNVCSSTWDGWLCWDEMPPGTGHQYCPDYVLEGVDRSLGSAQAVKVCNPNGTWMKKNGREWTNFKTCLAYDEYLVGVYINLGTNILSIMLLVPAIIIFISYS